MAITDMFDLQDKTIVITGGAGHLGKGMSEALAAFGANLFIVGNDKNKNEKVAADLKNEYRLSICEGRRMNIDCETEIAELFSEIVQKTGKIDVLINNAAYSSPGRIEDISDKMWCKGIDGTINSVFRVTKAVLPYMLQRGIGNIINTASMYGVVGPNPEIYGDSGYDNPANYGAGKAAVIQFTKYIATTYGKNGIRSNSLSPGPFPNAKVQENNLFVNRLCEKNPLGRIGKPEDLQGAIVFLSSVASSYMNGQNLVIDGGWTAW